MFKFVSIPQAIKLEPYNIVILFDNWWNKRLLVVQPILNVFLKDIHSWHLLWRLKYGEVNIPCLLKAHALVYWSHVNISTLFNQSEALWLTEGFTCPSYPRSCSDIALQGAFWPTPDTHAPKHIFRMYHEPSETSLLISPTPKHTDTHILKVVLLNTSRLIKSDSWITAVCLCLAVSNWRLPPLVLMCKLQSSQTDSCYRRGIQNAASVVFTVAAGAAGRLAEINTKHRHHQGDQIARKS